jgi:glycosyltransferase involved in cell wall biosynthesis
VKIVHIGDSDGGGGAAHAMSRLHHALRRAGVESQLLVRNSSGRGDAVETTATRGDADDLFPAVRDAVVRQYVELNRTSLTNTHFSLHIDGADVSRAPLVVSSNVVHLHWTASFQTPADVRALLNVKPVVWTLHDLEPLTGGCHFPAGCERFARDCAECPQLARDPFQITATTLHDKKTLWAGGRPTFVAPSRYMAERARLSAVAQNAKASIVHLPHGIDVDVFRPQAKAAARRALGVPEDGVYVLCGSNYNAERRKGLRFLNRVLAVAQAGLRLDPSQLRILTVGEPKLDIDDLGGTAVSQLGRVPVDLMPSVYAAADVFLHPSVEDNFPLMLLESLSCGTPAVAFDAGGAVEIVQDGVSGRVTAAGDELAMAAALASLLGDRQTRERMSERARARIEEHFSDAESARKHAELYDELAESSVAARAPASRSRKTGMDRIVPRLSTACLVQELALAHERASDLAEESRAKSEHVAALEHEAAALGQNLADQSRQVQEKETELAPIHAVAEERKALAETLHASAASIEALAANLQREIHERDDVLAKLEATIREKEAELAAIHAVAEERKTLAEKLHASAASIEAVAANLQRELRARDDLLAKLQAMLGEQRAEIDLVHHVAADRRLLIEDLHRVAEERAAVIDRLVDAPHEGITSASGS